MKKKSSFFMPFIIIIGVYLAFFAVASILSADTSKDKDTSDKRKHECQYELTYEQSATCTSAGYRHYECDCGDSYDYNLPALGHDLMLQNELEANCETTGWREYQCTRCDYSEQVTTSLGCHVNSDAVMENKTVATCDSAESYDLVIYCSICGKEVSRRHETIGTALGHDYQTVTYEWSEDNLSCTATRICSHDSEHIETETVQTVAKVTQNATYASDELTSYTATFTNIGFESQIKENVKTAEKLAHIYEETSYTWLGNNYVCKAIRICTDDASLTETETVTTTFIVTQNKTCTLDELTTFIAQFKNEAFETQVKADVKTADKLGHAYGEPTYVWADDYSTCTATRVCANDNSHVETETVESTSTITQNKTCTLDELTTYTATFKNETFTVQIQENVKSADKLGHDITHYNGVAATCTETGYEAYDTCSRCDYSTYNEIPKTLHKKLVCEETTVTISNYVVSNDTTYPFSVSEGILTSTNKAHSTSSTYTVTAETSFTMSLQYKVSSESGYDFLTIKYNDTQKAKVSGTTSWTTISIEMTMGDALTFTYSKDGSQSNGDDCAYIHFLTDEVVCTTTVQESYEEVTDTYLATLHSTCTQDVCCDVCNAVLVEKLGHDYTEVVYEWSSDCTECIVGETYHSFRIENCYAQGKMIVDNAWKADSKAFQGGIAGLFTDFKNSGYTVGVKNCLTDFEYSGTRADKHFISAIVGDLGANSDESKLSKNVENLYFVADTYESSDSNFDAKAQGYNRNFVCTEEFLYDGLGFDPILWKIVDGKIAMIL